MRPGDANVPQALFDADPILVLETSLRSVFAWRTPVNWSQFLTSIERCWLALSLIFFHIVRTGVRWQNLTPAKRLSFLNKHVGASMTMGRPSESCPQRPFSKKGIHSESDSKLTPVGGFPNSLLLGFYLRKKELTGHFSNPDSGLPSSWRQPRNPPEFWHPHGTLSPGIEPLAPAVWAWKKLGWPQSELPALLTLINRINLDTLWNMGGLHRRHCLGYLFETPFQLLGLLLLRGLRCCVCCWYWSPNVLLAKSTDDAGIPVALRAICVTSLENCTHPWHSLNPQAQW